MFSTPDILLNKCNLDPQYAKVLLNGGSFYFFYFHLFKMSRSFCLYGRKDEFLNVFIKICKFQHFLIKILICLILLRVINISATHCKSQCKIYRKDLAKWMIRDISKENNMFQKPYSFCILLPLLSFSKLCVFGILLISDFGF